MITIDGLIERIRPHTRAVPRAVLLILAVPLLPACTPICETVNNWTWGTCYPDIHGTDALAVHSELDSPPAAAHADAVESARILVKRFVREQNLPGLSVAVGTGGAIAWAEGFGWADINTARPVTPRTRFRIGGVAIPMTAAAVGLLLERGALDIDRPARSYVPAFPEKAWPVSTRQLMAHVAGIRHRDDEAMLYERTACTSPLGALELYGDDRLRFEPGTSFRYSSYGWTLVGAVVEATAGEPFLELMQREVFDALAMNDTRVDDPARPAPDTTTFYWPFAATDTTTGIEFANNPNDTCMQGAGGLLSTPSDLVRFGMAMNEGQLLEPATLELLRTPPLLASGEPTGHGLGWSVQELTPGPASDPVAAFGHDAVAAGGTTTLLTIPAQDLAIALTANVSYVRGLPELAAQIAGLFNASR